MNSRWLRPAGSGKDTGLDEYMHVYIHSTIYLFVSNHLMTTQSTNFRENFKLTEGNYFVSLGTTTQRSTLEGESQTPAGTAFLYPRKKRTKLPYKSRGPSTDWVFLRFQWRPSWMLRKKSFVESIWHAVGTGHGAMLHTSASPAASCFLSLPSNEAQAGLLLLNGT